MVSRFLDLAGCLARRPRRRSTISICQSNLYKAGSEGTNDQMKIKIMHCGSWLGNSSGLGFLSSHGFEKLARHNGG